MKTKKAFDCVELQDQGALRIYEALKGKSRAEVLAYWRERESAALKEFPGLRQAESSPK